MPNYTHIDTSMCVHVDDIDGEAWVQWGDEACDFRPLRKLDDGSVRSAHVTLAGGWTGKVSAASNLTQIFIRSGTLSFGDRALSENGFITLGSKAFVNAKAETPVELLVIFDHECSPDAGPADNVTITGNLYDLEPIIPVIDGVTLHGFEIRYPFVNPETGADTMFIVAPPGFRGGGPNFHPVHEEIFCLDGDIQPDETRPMRAGSYLWNPKQSVHGFDEVSHGGSVLLEWHDGPWDLTYAPGAERAAQ